MGEYLAIFYHVLMFSALLDQLWSQGKKAADAHVNKAIQRQGPLLSRSISSWQFTTSSCSNNFYMQLLKAYQSLWVSSYLRSICLSDESLEKGRHRRLHLT